LFNQFGELECAMLRRGNKMLRRGNKASAKYWREVLLPVIEQTVASTRFDQLAKCACRCGVDWRVFGGFTRG